MANGDSEARRVPIADVATYLDGIAPDVRPSLTTLDKATIRTGRFDAIVEVGYPSRAAAARILAGLVAGLPGGSGGDTATVVAGRPEQINGSDLREIVRRAVLSVPDGEPISTDGLLAEIGGGRYRAAVPEGLYL